MPTPISVYSPLLPALARQRLARVGAAAPPFTPPADAFNSVFVPHLQNMARTQIFYGGASSGKSVFLAQRDVLDLLAGGRNFLVCRAVGRTLRKSVFAEAVKVIGGWGLTHRFNIHKSEMTITCDNGYQMLFSGLDDTEKLKSITPERGAITDVRVEEATEVAPDDLKQLVKRQRGGDAGTAKRLVLSFNPILKTHHIYQNFFAPLGWADDQTEYTSPELSILKTWYIHNRFLTPGDVVDLESEMDDYYRTVYTLGNWGVLGEVIFTNWSVQDLSGMRRQFTNHRHGLDFGFSSNPAAVVVTHYDRNHKTVYIYDELYEAGLTNDQLAADVKALIGGQPVTCDSAEPKSITELRRYGVSARPASKGKDSIKHGIQWLRQQRLVVDRACVNTQAELGAYHWKKDRDGNATDMPVDRNEHLIDALRYAYENEFMNIDADSLTGLGQVDGYNNPWG